LEGYDIGPLFEVLQQFGGANVVTDLERVSSQWNFYSVIALGGLAGGAGIPALTRMAQDTAIPNVMALRMLAQMAAKDPAAKAALMAQVRANKIPYAAWTGIAAALGGESIEYGAPVITGAGGLAGPNVRTYHITYGNQNYRTVPVTEWRPVAINEQLAIIDQLVATNLNLEALQFLQDARLSVAGRQSK
jgi:hypothetical protein